MTRRRNKKLEPVAVLNEAVIRAIIVDQRLTRGCVIMDGSGSKQTALDAATEAFACRCDRENCEIRQLVPFREHLAELYRAITTCHEEGLLPAFVTGDGASEGWEAVAYGLHMAASLEDVAVDTAFVDAIQSWSYCEPVADFEKAHSASAGRYFAAAITFSFIWNAYESSIRVAAKNLFAKHKTAVRGRKLAAALGEGEGIRLLPRLTRGAVRYCAAPGDLETELADLATRFPAGQSAESSADLARLLRNHVAHGRDPVPLPDGWADYPAERVYRLYSVGKLLLILIQLFAAKSLTDPAQRFEVEVDDEAEDDGPKRESPSAFEWLTSLHLRHNT